MKISNVLVLVALIGCFGIGSSAVAEEKKSDDRKAEMFQKRKEQNLKEIEERLAEGTALKACISAAQDHEAMKKCRQDHRKNRQEHRQDRQGRQEPGDQKK